VLSKPDPSASRTVSCEAKKPSLRSASGKGTSAQVQTTMQPSVMVAGILRRTFPDSREALDSVWQSNNWPTGGYDVRTTMPSSRCSRLRFVHLAPRCALLRLDSSNKTYHSICNAAKRSGHTPIRRDTALVPAMFNGALNTMDGWHAWRPKVDEAGCSYHILQHQTMAMFGSWRSCRSERTRRHHLILRVTELQRQAIRHTTRP
jgi:hypothetical protein